MKRYYCYVEVESERKYYRADEVGRANETAQAEANRTGRAVKRNDCDTGGYSMFYPTRGKK